MNRNLIRIVAALLVPCLLADPGMASIGPVGAVAVKGDCPQSDFHSIQSIEISGRHGSLLLRVFASQALAPPYGHSSISTGSKVREAQREIVQVRSISEVPPAAPPDGDARLRFQELDLKQSLSELDRERLIYLYPRLMMLPEGPGGIFLRAQAGEEIDSWGSGVPAGMRLWVARDADHQIQAYLLAVAYPEYMFLQHLVVALDLSRKGEGTRLFEYVTKQLAASPGVWQIRFDNTSEDVTDQGIPPSVRIATQKVAPEWRYQPIDVVPGLHEIYGLTVTPELKEHARTLLGHDSAGSRTAGMTAAPPASSVTDSDVADYLKKVGIRAREQRQASGNSMRDLKGERLRLDWISKFERGKSDALIRIVVHYADGNRVSAVPILDPEAAVPVAWNPETPQPDVNDIYQNVTSLVKEKKRERITGANLAAKGGFSSVLAFYMIIKHLRIGLTVRISALYRLSRALDVTISRLLEKRSPSEEGPRDRQRSRAA